MSMLSEEALAGYLLEEALAGLLFTNGYRLLRSPEDDPDALSKAGNGLLVRGRGADHQADVLGDLLVPSPFSHPVRLFVEAKNRGSKAELVDVRNAHGVIADVNEHYSTAGVANYVQPLSRFLYRYVLFSAGGFSENAQKYALAQQISLIDLSGPAFRPLVELVNEAAADLRSRAVTAGMTSFPVSQVRNAMRLALDEWGGDRGRPAPTAPMGAEGASFGEAQLVRWAKDFTTRLGSTGLGQELLLGFPAAPFILVLRPDDMTAFAEYVAGHPGDIDVRIGFTGSPGRAGDWSIQPADGSRGFRLRFGLPGVLESWLLEAGEDALERAAQAKRQLLHTISVFLENQLIRLQFVPELRADQSRSAGVATDAASLSQLRRALAVEPEPSRASTEIDYSTLDESRSGPSSFRWDESGSPEWTPEAVGRLLSALVEGGYVQGELIREAARRNGELTRSQVYEIGGFPPQRSLKGLTRPTNRITSELVADGELSAEVPWPFVAWYESGVLATHFHVPPDIVRIMYDYGLLER